MTALLVTVILTCLAVNSSAKLLVISFDGFRWDYLNRVFDKNHFDVLIKNGVHAPNGVENVFVTKTFPNHYSMVTGLYEENHGILGSSVFVPEYNQTIKVAKADTKKYPNLFQGEPIWVTHQRQRHSEKVGCVLWFGCNHDIKGFKLSPSVQYNCKTKCMTFTERMDLALEWLFIKDLDFVLLYHNFPDYYGHRTGADSLQITMTVNNINQRIGYLLERLESYNSSLDEIDLMIVSDHGMSTVNETVMVKAKLDLFEIIAKEDTIFQIRPKMGKTQETFDYLQKFEHTEVYRKEDIPERWHFKNSDRIMPIILIAKEGYVLAETEAYVRKSGTHGYDNALPSMRPVFIASGPSFKKNVTINNPEQLRLVDYYNIMCSILGLKPAPNNGSRQNANRVLRQPMQV